MHSTFLKNLWAGLKARHIKNKEKGVYGYMWKTSLKIIAIYLLIMIPAVLIGKYLIDINAMVVIAVSLFKYPFKMYLLFGISRILRFIIQGVFYLDVLKLDSILNK